MSTRDANASLDLHHPESNGATQAKSSTPTVTFTLWFWNHSLRAHVQMNRICIACNTGTTLRETMRILRSFGWLSQRLSVVGVYDHERRVVNETDVLEPARRYSINVCLHNTYVCFRLYLQPSTGTTLSPVFLATIDRYVVRPISLATLLSQLYQEGHVGSDWVISGIQNCHTGEVYDINDEDPACLQEAVNDGSTLNFALILKPWLPEEEHDEETARSVGDDATTYATGAAQPDEATGSHSSRTSVLTTDVPGIELHQAIWELLSTTGTIPRTRPGREGREPVIKPFTGTAYRLE